MKKYINLETFMSLLYLLTFIFLAVLMNHFPQSLSAEPTILGAILCGTNIGLALDFFINSFDSISRHRQRRVAKRHGSDEAFELVDHLLMDFADSSNQFKTAPEIMSVLYATFEEKRKEYEESQK